jgi:mono/diheme cytochrome c family protein
MEYHQIVILHRIVVSLFLLHYVVKGYFLIADKKETLAGYTAKTKIAEMILSFLFLGTGIYLLARGPSVSILMWIKLALVFASIPLAVIGFKKGNKALAMLSIAFLLGAYGLAEVNKKQYAKMDKAPVDTSTVAADPLAVGRTIYMAKCTACHGENGDAGLGGAKNLRITQLTDDQLKDIIKHGKGGMSAYPDLTDDQLNGVVTFIKALKQ